MLLVFFVFSVGCVSCFFLICSFSFGDAKFPVQEYTLNKLWILDELRIKIERTRILPELSSIYVFGETYEGRLSAFGLI